MNWGNGLLKRKYGKNSDTTKQISGAKYMTQKEVYYSCF